MTSLVLVDSTRAGKRIPDALSKTVPIWCAVINRATLLVHPEKAKEESWDVELYCPPGAVSEQERSQIKARLDGWARDLSVSLRIMASLHSCTHIRTRDLHTVFHLCRDLFAHSGSLLPHLSSLHCARWTS